jgi:large subunit ribosomal protein L5
MSEQKLSQENVMRKPKLAKVVLSAGATGADLEKATKLLEMFSDMKVQIIKSGPKQRIPSFGVRPLMPLGARVTLRGKKALDLLRRLLGAIDNEIKKKKLTPNHFSFGIQEYIEIPGTEYVREIGIRGFNVTVVFERAGLRVKRKKLKRGKVPKKQYVSVEEIIKFMEDSFKTKFI